MPNQNTEAELIRRAKSGDKAAISELYERYVERIYRYVAYRVPEEDAEDLTAEVFVRMVESIANYEYTGAPFEAWLYRIASTRVADYHRRRQRQQTDEMDDNISDNMPEPEESLLDALEQSSVREALLSMSEEEQELLILRFVERKSHKEVADIMGKNEAAIRTAQHRALKKLAQLLDIDTKARHYLRGSQQIDSE